MVMIGGRVLNRGRLCLFVAIVVAVIGLRIAILVAFLRAADARATRVEAMNTCQPKEQASS